MSKYIDKYGNYFKSGFLYLGSSLLVSVIGILINPFLAKNLSPDDYAIIGYFTSFTLLLTPLLHVNMITYYLRKYFFIPEEKREITSNTILIGLTFFGLIVLLLFTGIFYIYCKYANVEFPFFPYAIIIFSQIYLCNFTTFYLTKLRIQRKARKFGIVTIVNSLIGVILSLILVVYYKFGADGRVWALLIAAFIMAVYSFSKTITKWEFDFSIIKEALKFGLPLTLSSLLWYFFSGIDRAMLAEFNDTYTFGIYSVGIQIAGYMTIFYTSVSNTLDPDIYQAIANNNIPRLKKLLIGIIVIITLVNAVFIIFAPWVIGLLTANRYIDSTPFAQIFALHNITMALYNVTAKLFVGYGMVKTELLVRIIGAVLSVTMYKVLIDKFQFYGGAWGSVFSFLIVSIVGLIIFTTVKRKRISNEQ